MASNIWFFPFTFIARTCNNSCTATNQICSDEGGYNCTCQDGYTKISDDVPCQGKLNTMKYAKVVT